MCIFLCIVSKILDVHLYDLGTAKTAVLCIEFNFLMLCQFHSSYQIWLQYLSCFNMNVSYQNFNIILFILQFTFLSHELILFFLTQEKNIVFPNDFDCRILMDLYVLEVSNRHLTVFRNFLFISLSVCDMNFCWCSYTQSVKSTEFNKAPDTFRPWHKMARIRFWSISPNRWRWYVAFLTFSKIAISQALMDGNSLNFILC